MKGKGRTFTRLLLYQPACPEDWRFKTRRVNFYRDGQIEVQVLKPGAMLSFNMVGEGWGRINTGLFSICYIPGPRLDI